MAIPLNPAGIREKLNENPAITTAVTAGLIVVAAAIIFLEVHGCGGSSAGPGTGKIFFSDDDGKTWFADDASKAPPFDHNGHPAYRAMVFKCGEQEFVGHLESYPADVKAKLDEIRSTQPRIGYQAFKQFSDQKLVKRPGDKDWVSMAKPDEAKKYLAVVSPHPPAGCTADKMQTVTPQ